MAKISVIVPVYKAEKYLRRCVDSILNQSYTDFEVLLIEDGSPDNSGKICDEYAQKDQRIFVIHQKNAGISVVRNTGLDWVCQQGRSEYITFVDSDDWIHPEYLKVLMNGVTENGVIISVCNHKRVVEEIACESYDSIEYELTSPEDFLVNHSWQYNYIWCKLYHKSVFDDIRYPVGKIFEDTFTTYKLLHKCKEISYTDCQLYYYFRNEHGITRSPWTPSELVIFDAMQEQMQFYKENGLQKAFDKEFELFVHHYAYQMARIKENKIDFKKNKSMLKSTRRILRKYLKENKDKFNIHNMTYSYEAAYPFAMKIYTFISRVKTKILCKKNDYT